MGGRRRPRRPFLGIALGAATPAGDDRELALRKERAYAGDITDGGVATPREAAAFVHGYLVRRYIPARSRSLSAEQRAKLTLLAARYLPVAEAGSDVEAAALAASAGSTSVLDTIKQGIATVFEVLAAPLDTPRGAAVQVLEHAAATLAAMGEPAAAQRMAEAAGATEAAARGVLTGVASAAREVAEKAAEVAGRPVEAAREVVQQATAAADDVVARAEKAVNLVAGKVDALQQSAERIVDRAAEIPAELERRGAALVSGAMNTAAKARDELVDQGKRLLDDLDRQARALAAEGQAAVGAQLDKIRALADRAAEIAERASKIPADASEAVKAGLARAQDTLRALIDSAGAKLLDLVERARAEGTAAARELAAQFEAKLRAAMEAGAAAGRAMRDTVAAGAAAFEAKIDDKLARLSATAETALRRADESATALTRRLQSAAYAGIAGLVLLFLVVLLRR